MKQWYALYVLLCSYGNVFRITDPLWENHWWRVDSSVKGAVMWSSDVFFVISFNKLLEKFELLVILSSLRLKQWV